MQKRFSSRHGFGFWTTYVLNKKKRVSWLIFFYLKNKHTLERMEEDKLVIEFSLFEQTVTCFVQLACTFYQFVGFYEFGTLDYDLNLLFYEGNRFFFNIPSFFSPKTYKLARANLKQKSKTSDSAEQV